MAPSRTSPAPCWWSRTTVTCSRAPPTSSCWWPTGASSHSRATSMTTRWLVDYRARQQPASSAGRRGQDRQTRPASGRRRPAPATGATQETGRQAGAGAGRCRAKLAAVEDKLGDSGLYEAARKDELRELLAEQLRSRPARPSWKRPGWRPWKPWRPSSNWRRASDGAAGSAQMTGANPDSGRAGAADPAPGWPSSAWSDAASPAFGEATRRCRPSCWLRCAGRCAG